MTVNRGFPGLRCVLCGQEATIRVDLDDCCTFSCTECDDEFKREDVEQQLADWARVLAWLDQAPERPAT